MDSAWRLDLDLVAQTPVARQSNFLLQRLWRVVFSQGITKFARYNDTDGRTPIAGPQKCVEFDRELEVSESGAGEKIPHLSH